MKKLRPTNNAQRNTLLTDYSQLVATTTKYPRKLFQTLKTNAGRNNQGKITVRHQGAGHKRQWRMIDFKRYPQDGIEGTVKSIEYDPYRTCFISLISYHNGSKTFILNPTGLKVGTKIQSGENEKIPIETGNNLPLRYIPDGTFIHNVELKPKKGGQLIRSAGTSAQVVGREENGKYVLVRLKSKELRKILATCRATIGKVGNEEHNLVKLGKAGRNRWRGIRPTVRGSAMNPVDHPHGGGEGKAGIGHKSPMDPWGNKTLGKKTRRKKPSSKYIIRSRHQAKK